MNSYRNFLPLTSLCLILGAPQLFSADTAPFRTGLRGIYPSACHAALLLTPEQTTILQDAWKRRSQKIQKIRESGSDLTMDQRQSIRVAEQEFDQKSNEVLTPAQRDTVLLINDIFASVSKTVAADFQQQIDADLEKKDKKNSVKERSKALSAAFEKELMAVLPADRFAAFKAAQIDQ